MKDIKSVLLAVLMMTFMASLASAQINWTQNCIDPDAASPRAVYPVDMDGDGDIDIIGGNATEINWYENNGYQVFWKTNVDPSFSNVYSVYAADVDSDGDLDILGASSGDHLAWWENDGDENFTYNFLAFFNSAFSVKAVDMDDDGDMDVLAASSADDKIAWFENDGNQMFMEHIMGTPDNARYVFPIDVGNDGDLDVFGCAYTDDAVYVYLNDGSQNFTEYNIAYLNGAYCVKAADLDGDGDIDGVACGYSDDIVNWYENDGSDTLFIEHNISIAADMVRSLDVCDLDDDGDIDVLVGAYLDSYILVYTNDGTGNFTEQLIEYYRPYMLFGGDVDSDGDMDIVACSYGGTIDWLESDFLGAFPLEMTLTPINPPIQVPAGGGSFDFDIELLNNSPTETFVVDFWTNVTLPTGNIVPIMSASGISLAPGANILRSKTQYVPGTVMPGEFIYHGHVRDNATWQVYLEDSFDFEKLEGFDSPNHNFGWAVFGWDEEDLLAAVPSEYALFKPYPNPFNPEASLTFALKEAGYTTLVVYNIEGKEITRLADGWYAPGLHEVTFDGAQFSSGVYFARLSSGSFNQTQKLLLAK